MTHQTSSANSRPSVLHDLAALSVLFVVFAVLFGPLLLPGNRSVLSHSTGDTSQFFIPMRAFAADEIRAGRLPLWNPYLMSGTSFIGNFQSAMFYPPNAIYLVLPVERAVNADYAFHLFLCGLFMYLWARGRGVSPRGATLSAFIGAFSAPVYLRMMGGQVTMVDAMAWAPLVFLSIDKVFDRAAARGPVLGWILAGAFAVGMQILAGHPQTVFITGLSAGLYCALQFPGASRRTVATVSLIVLGAWGGALGAIQLLPGLETTNEGLRTGGIDTFGFTTTFSFPPENFIDLAAPSFFADREHLMYWGRWSVWDASLFFGVAGLLLAIYGAKYAGARQRRYAPFLIVLLAFIALGQYSPVYRVFNLLPIFGTLRGVSKFMFAAVMFAGILAGLGVDRLAADSATRRPRRIALVAFAACAAIAGGIAFVAFAAFARSGTVWRELLFRQMSDGVFALAWFAPPENYFRDTALWSIGSLTYALVLVAGVAAMFWNAGRRSVWVTAICLVGLAELVAYAAFYRVRFDSDILRDEEVERFYADRPGDYRVMRLGDPLRVYRRNHGMSVRRPAVWGYEPVIHQRYGMFVCGASLNEIRQMAEMLEHARWGSDVIQVGLNKGYIDFEEDPATGQVTLPNAFDLARCRYVIVPEGMPNTQPGIYENPEAMPRFSFIADYIRLDNPSAVVQLINDPEFDPRQKVILESTPDPAPNPLAGTPQGTVVIEDESTDHLTLRVTVDRPAILLITDAISGGWRTTTLEGSSQAAYPILPADFAFFGIPLSEGSHHFRLEYRPRGFEIGLQVTFVAGLAFAAALIYWLTITAGGYLAKKAR